MTQYQKLLNGGPIRVLKIQFVAKYQKIEADHLDL